jgi:hypothetical protein
VFVDLRSDAPVNKINGLVGEPDERSKRAETLEVAGISRVGQIIQLPAEEIQRAIRDGWYSPIIERSRCRYR